MLGHSPTRPRAPKSHQQAVTKLRDRTGQLEALFNDPLFLAERLVDLLKRPSAPVTPELARTPSSSHTSPQGRTVVEVLN